MLMPLNKYDFLKINFLKRVQKQKLSWKENVFNYFAELL